MGVQLKKSLAHGLTCIRRLMKATYFTFNVLGKARLTSQISKVQGLIGEMLWFLVFTGDGQVDFEEFMTILGPKLLSSETRESFLGSTIDTIFWQVCLLV